MVDYLIVGQGIAGSILAWELIQQGYSVKIIDLSSGEPSSRQAAGLINPVTGRRFVKSWMIDDLLPSAISTYSSIAKILKLDFFEVTKGNRPINNVEQLNDIEAKALKPEYENYLQSNVEVLNPNQINNPLGCIGIYGLLHANVIDMLDALRDFFVSKDLLISDKFYHEDLILKADSVLLDNIPYENVVFCEGYNLRNNEWFNHLPLRPVKGEALIIESEDLKLSYPVLGSTSIIPLGERKFYVGSTYDWNDESLEPTSEKRSLLLKNLKEVLLAPFKVVGHKVGMRPATLDRRPLIGRHPEHKNLILFNGLGTKGLSIAPYFAKHLIRHLAHDEQLIKEVDIARFTK